MLVNILRLVIGQFLSLLIILSLVICVFAQAGATTGVIVGSVRDQQNSVLVGANITVRNLETNLTRSTQTNEKGSYLIPQLSPGKYELLVTANNFSDKKELLVISLGVTSLVDFTLSPTDTREIIEITASTAISETNTESNTTIGQQQILSLPTSRRNFLDFAILAPRVATDRTPSIGITGGSGLSFNGQAGRFNNITIDGLDNNDSGTGSVRSTFAQDAVKEFQIVSDGASAEFGRALSGIVNIVTQAGGNDYHANLFFFNRNNSLNARNAFNSTKAPFSQYQFGTIFSGPIKHDRVFFFGSLERLTSKDSFLAGISDNVIASIRRQGFPVTNGATPFSIGSTSALFRLDGSFNSNHTFWLRYNGGFTYNGRFEKDTVTEKSATAVGVQKLNDNSVAFSNTYIIPNLSLVNETRFLFGRRDQNVLALSQDPFIDIVGNGAFGQENSLPQPRLEYIYQLVNITSLVRGQHQIKFGVDFQSLLSPEGDTKILFLSKGGYSFADLDFADLLKRPGFPKFTAIQAFDPSLRTSEQLAFLNFISGILPSSYPGFPKNISLANTPLPLFFGQGFGKPTEKLTAKFFSAFIEDEFKPKSNLILRLGLRYDLNRVRFAPSNNGNFSPRIGLAYIPFPNKLANLKFRASYGLFFGTPFTGPVLQSQLYSSGNYSLLVLVPPFSALPYLLPNHGYADNSKLPTNVPDIRQYSIEYQYQTNARNSYSQQANLGVSYQLKKDVNFSITYSFLRGIKLTSRREINPVVRPIAGDLLGGYERGRIQIERGSVLEYENAFDSYYNGVSLVFDYHFNQKINLTANYTYSKSIDNILNAFKSDIFDEANDPLMPGKERGLSFADLRNRFVLSGVWNLDYTKNPLLKDFQLSTIVLLNSGVPYNLAASQDLNMNDSGGDRPLGLGRNVGITAGFASVDLRLARNFSFREKFHTQFTFEVFNLLNRVNLNPDRINRAFLPDQNGNYNLPPKQGSLYTLPKDRYLEAFSARQIQLGVRFSF